MKNIFRILPFPQKKIKQALRQVELASYRPRKAISQ